MSLSPLAMAADPLPPGSPAPPVGSASAKPLPPSLGSLSAQAGLAKVVGYVATGAPGLDALLPGGGVPRGALTEICSPQGLGRSSTVALLLCAGAQAEARARGGEASWCAFLDAGQSLYAPAVSAAGVELERLLIVRPPLDALTRVAVRVVSSRAFSVVIIDTGGVPGATLGRSLSPWAAAARRLALATEGSDTAVVLLTRAEASRTLPLPVALRLDLAQPSKGKLLARVSKERGGKITDWALWSLPGPEAAQKAGASGSSRPARAGGSGRSRPGVSDGQQSLPLGEPGEPGEPGHRGGSER